jgi:hypothetical protein
MLKREKTAVYATSSSAIMYLSFLVALFVKHIPIGV